MLPRLKADFSNFESLFDETSPNWAYTRFDDDVFRIVHQQQSPFKILNLSEMEALLNKILNGLHESTKIRYFDPVLFEQESRLKDSVAKVNSTIFWAGQLKHYMKDAYPIPFRIRKELMHLFSELFLIQGNSKSYKSFYYDMLISLSSGCRAELKKVGLSFDFRPLLEFYFGVEHSTIFKFKCQSTSSFTLIYSFISVVSDFFDDNDLDDIFKAIVEKYRFLDDVLVFVPKFNTNVSKYVKYFFAEWRNGCIEIPGILKAISENFVELQSKQYVPYVELFDETQLNFFFYEILGNLNIYDDLVDPNENLGNVENIACIIANSINQKNSEFVLSKLDAVSNSIQTYLLSVNNVGEGNWTQVSQRFLDILIELLSNRVRDQKRMKMERSHPLYIDEAFVLKFMEIVAIPNAFLMVSPSQPMHFVNIGDLCYLNPKYVLSYVLLSFDRAYTRNVTTELMSVSLQAFSHTAEQFCEQKVYRCCVVPLLYKIMDNIDINNSKNTFYAMQCLKVYAMHLPFVEASEPVEGITEYDCEAFLASHFQHLVLQSQEKLSDRKDFEYEPEYEERIFLATTFGYEKLIRKFTEKFCMLMWKLCDNFEQEFSFKSFYRKHEQLITDSSELFLVLTSSCSDKLYDILAYEFLKFFGSNMLYESTSLCISVVSNIIMKDESDKWTSKFIRVCLDKLYASMEDYENTVSKTYEEKSICFYGYLLQNALLQSGTRCIPFLNEIANLARFNLYKVNKDISLALFDCIVSATSSLLSPRLLSFKFIRSSVTNRELLDYCDNLWLEYDYKSYSEAMADFKWFVPSENEVNVAFEFAVQMYDMFEKRVDELLSIENKDVQSELLVALQQLTSILSIFKYINNDFLDDDTRTTDYNKVYGAILPKFYQFKKRVGLKLLDLLDSTSQYGFVTKTLSLLVKCWIFYRQQSNSKQVGLVYSSYYKTKLFIGFFLSQMGVFNHSFSVFRQRLDEVGTKLYEKMLDISVNHKNVKARKSAVLVATSVNSVISLDTELSDFVIAGIEKCIEKRDTELLKNYLKLATKGSDSMILDSARYLRFIRALVNAGTMEDEIDYHMDFLYDSDLFVTPTSYQLKFISNKFNDEKLDEEATSFKLFLKENYENSLLVYKELEQLTLKTLQNEKTHWRLALLLIDLQISAVYSVEFFEPSFEMIDAIIKLSKSAHVEIRKLGLSYISLCLEKGFLRSIFPNVFDRIDVRRKDPSVDLVSKNQIDTSKYFYNELKSDDAFFVKESILLYKKQKFELEPSHMLAYIGEKMDKEYVGSIILYFVERSFDGDIKEPEFEDVAGFLSDICRLMSVGIASITVEELYDILHDILVKIASQNDGHEYISAILWYTAARFPLYTQQDIDMRNEKIFQIVKFCVKQEEVYIARTFENVFNFQFWAIYETYKPLFKRLAEEKPHELFSSINGSLGPESLSTLLNSTLIEDQAIISKSNVTKLLLEHKDKPKLYHLNEYIQAPFSFHLSDLYASPDKLMTLEKEIIRCNKICDEINKQPNSLGQVSKLNEIFNVYCVIYTAINSSVSAIPVDFFIRVISPFLLNYVKIPSSIIGTTSVRGPGRLYAEYAVVRLINPEEADKMIDLFANDGFIEGHITILQHSVLLSFVAKLYYYNYFFLSEEQYFKILRLLLKKTIEHDLLSIREKASKVIASLIHHCGTDLRERAVNYLIKECVKVLQSNHKSKKLRDASKIHGTTLVLGAIIDAVPYVVPPPKWTLEVFGLFIKYCIGVNAEVSKALKDCLKTFKATRSTSWDDIQLTFPQEILDDLYELSGSHYYV